MRSILIAALVSVVAAGCAGTHDGDPQLDAALSNVKTETTHHATLCASAANMSDVVRELQRYDEAIAPLLDDVDRSMTTMHERTCAAAREHMDPLMGDLSAIRSAVRDHDARMMSASDLADAQAECSRYRSDMLGLCSATERHNDSLGCR